MRKKVREWTQAREREEQDRMGLWYGSLMEVPTLSLQGESLLDSGSWNGASQMVLYYDVEYEYCLFSLLPEQNLLKRLSAQRNAGKDGGGHKCSERDLFAHALCWKWEQVFLLNVSLVGLFPNTLNSDSAKINLLLDSSLKGDGRRRWVRELLFFKKKKKP